MSKLSLSLLLGTAIFASSNAIAAEKKHCIALYGECKYKQGFKHFDYANPNAPKGGKVKLAGMGSFDNLNAFILKGIAPDDISLLTESLTTGSQDEPFSQYGLLAEYIEVAEDKSAVTYYLRKKAKWHDGVSISADDVVFSFNTLMEHGHPAYKQIFGDIAKVEKLDNLTIKFTFKPDSSQEIWHVAGQIPILPKHFWEKEENDFTKTTLKPILGSGPYKISKLDAGNYITYERVENYWAKDLAINAGRYNYNTVRYDFYPDPVVAVEALKSGEYDLRYENISKNWATAYNIESVKAGKLKKELIGHSLPTGMQAFVFNTRNEFFKNINVRKALNLTFDFNWVNKNIFYNAYTPTNSYFSNSDYAATGRPNELELDILKKYTTPQQLVRLQEPFKPTITNGTGRDRSNLLKARDLLANAGYTVKNMQLVDKNDKPIKLEFLLRSSSFERVIAHMIKNMAKLGIEAKIRKVDDAQYKKRLDTFDYDMIVSVWGSSLSPGNEQFNQWHSRSSNVNGSRNYAGINSPLIDSLVENLVNAKTKPQLVNSAKALDRALLSGHYVIPNWFIQSFRLVYWDKFERAKIMPKYDYGFYNWWLKEEYR